MDIYSSKKKAKHAAPRKKKRAKNKNVFIKIKEWFLNLPKKKRTVVVALTSVFLVLTILLGTVIGIFLDLTKDYNYSNIDDDEINSIVPINEGIINIALFGIDSRKVGSFKGLSDSIMILSLNTDTGKINIISVMRDSLVEIPGKKVNKINSAYNAGGPALAIKTLNQNFGLDIKEYATVNFFGMADIIDAVGGIEVDVQKNEIHAVGGANQCILEQAYHLGVEPDYIEKEGLQTLNGMQAVGWARIRKVSTAEGVSDDYGRTDRQRYVMEQLLNKALSMSVKDYPALIKALLPHMETSLSYSEIIKLAGMFTKNITFEQTRVPQHSYVMNGPAINRVGSYVYYNLDFASDIIHALIYDGISQDDYIKQNGVVKKGWYDAPVSNSSGSTTSSSDSSSNITSSDDTSSDTSSEDSSANDSSDQSSSQTSS
ncbi:MAG: LCP family protein, partial [Clostridia bacterium]|nr:LCP family protein [Clostridia bacterium]